jgi:hypothetical protein
VIGVCAVDVNERLARLKNETLDNQIAFIEAHLAIELTFLQIALIEERSGYGEGRDVAKEKAERTVEVVRHLLPLIEDRIDTVDREWIQARLAELESVLATF